jgi:hypothetical protein
MTESSDPLSGRPDFHIVTVGWIPSLIAKLADPVAAKSSQRFSHIVHPRHTAADYPGDPARADIRFFRPSPCVPLAEVDRDLLASLERNGVPSIHNMILGDRVVAKLDYEEALGYATFLARRLVDFYQELKPDAVIIGFDAIHAGIALAVARSRDIPVYALHFSVIPAGMACFCDRMSPAARIVVKGPDPDALRVLAERSLDRFLKRETQARAYLAPPPRSLLGKAMSLPARLRATARTLRNDRKRAMIKFTDGRNQYSVGGVLKTYWNKASSRTAIERVPTLSAPPDQPFVLFGLHMQPESSIDVWAPFFSNQMWVIELLARSVPPTHKLLVKIHKSDAANYSLAKLKQMLALPGVELVAPFSDSRQFLERTDLLVAIQGTMGLEAALLGKPVIMLGDSPVTLFPSASGVAGLRELPGLVRAKLAQRQPDREEIVAAFVRYLEPFLPASDNFWDQERTGVEIDGYVDMFAALEDYLRGRQGGGLDKFTGSDERRNTGPLTRVSLDRRGTD